MSFVILFNSPKCQLISCTESNRIDSPITTRRTLTLSASETVAPEAVWQVGRLPYQSKI